VRKGGGRELAKPGAAAHPASRSDHWRAASLMAGEPGLPPTAVNRLQPTRHRPSRRGTARGGGGGEFELRRDRGGSGPVVPTQHRPWSGSPSTGRQLNHPWQCFVEAFAREGIRAQQGTLFFCGRPSGREACAIRSNPCVVVFGRDASMDGLDSAAAQYEGIPGRHGEVRRLGDIYLGDRFHRREACNRFPRGPSAPGAGYSCPCPGGAEGAAVDADCRWSQGFSPVATAPPSPRSFADRSEKGRRSCATPGGRLEASDFG